MNVVTRNDDHGRVHDEHEEQYIDVVIHKHLNHQYEYFNGQSQEEPYFKLIPNLIGCFVPQNGLD
jgi:hypothetical protein